ncbi:MAG: hypothetical protein Q4B54_06755 [Coriobacteriales bacterium]|nr:hypothetical protein [Coriobacteriales bacterium]
MSKNNAEQFAEMLATHEGARRALGRLAESFKGDKADDRAVYREILSPVAERYGLELSFDEALGLGAGAHQLSDDELDAVAGGAGATIYQRLIAGVLTGVMVVGAVPAAAFAEEAQGSPDAGGEAIVQVDDQTTDAQAADQATDDAHAGDQATDDAQDDAEQAGEGAEDADGEDLLMDSDFTPVSFAATSSSSQGWAPADAQKMAKDTTTVTKTLSDVGKLFVGLGGGSANPSLVFSGADGLMGDLLNIMGLGGSTGPTLADVMDELKDIEGKLDRMDQKLTNTERDVDVLNARTLIRNANDLSSYCDSVEYMFSDESLARLGVGPCPENASDEERNAWIAEAVAAVKKADDEDTAGFIGYRYDMEQIRKLFTSVANAAKEPDTTNPIGAWDDYWETYYNWETEAWAPKQALRTQTATQISRAYTQLSVYLGIYNDDSADPAISQLAEDSLNHINSMSAGARPDQAYAKIAAGDPAFSHAVYSYTLQRYATSSMAPCYQCNYNSTGAAVQDSAINEYKGRLHGMSILDDLKLAGLVDPNYTPDSNTRGIAFQGEKSGGNWWVRTLNWDGSYNSVKSCNGSNPSGAIRGCGFLDLEFLPH